MSPTPVPTGSVHAHTRNTLYCPGGVESRSQLVEQGAATCVGTYMSVLSRIKIQNHDLCVVPANSRQTRPAHSMHTAVPAHSRQTVHIHIRQIDPVHSTLQQEDWACPRQAEGRLCLFSSSTYVITHENQVRLRIVRGRLRLSVHSNVRAMCCR